jgi:MarR family transcriptional regulator, organic hydroperoxide resistance regulator
MDKSMLNKEPLPVLLGLAHRTTVKKFMYIVSHAGYDLSLDQWMVLMPVWKNNGIAQNEIVEKCGKGKASVTRIISTLENKNIVVRVKGHTDQRKKHIHLTQKGMSLFDKIEPLMKNTRNNMRSIISENDANITRKVLIAIIERLGTNVS